MAELRVDLEIETGKAARKAESDMKGAGRKSGAAFSSGFKVSLGAIAASIAGVAALAKSINFFKESIAAAAIQQQAINDLNTQLSITGQFTQAVSNDLQNFASQLQATSRFGDEAVLSQLAFAQAMGASAEQSKLVVSAAADMAESLNIDLNSATRNVAKTLGGYAGELGEVIPELKNLTQEQLRAGEGITLLAEKFGGAAAGRVRTFAGATAQLSNTFGDFQESIGRVITNSPAFIAVLNTTASLISELTNNVKALSANDPLAGFLQTLISVSRVVNETLIPPFRIFVGIVQTSFNVLKLAAQNTITVIATVVDTTLGNLLGALSKLPGKVGEYAGQASEILANIAATTQEQLAAQTGEVFNDLVTPEQTENFKMRVDEILTKYQEAIDKSREFKTESINAFKESGTAIASTAASVGKSLNNTLGNAVAGGIEKITQSLIAGENVFKAFGQAALGLVADFAIQAGKLFVATGIAQLALFSSPAASIAAGAALIAAGTLAKSFFGGGKGGDATQPAGVSSGPLPTQPEFTTAAPEERLEPETRVQVTIQGDVFDTEETGLRITKILEDSSLNQNVRVVGGLA